MKKHGSVATSNKTTNLIIPAAQPQLDDSSWKAIILPKNSQPVSQENWLRKRREAIISTETTSFKPEKVVDNKQTTIQPNHQSTQEAIQLNQNKQQRLNFKNDKEAIKKRLKTKIMLYNSNLTYFIQQDYRSRESRNMKLEIKN